MTVARGIHTCSGGFLSRRLSWPGQHRVSETRKFVFLCKPWYRLLPKRRGLSVTWVTLGYPLRNLRIF